MEKLCIKSFKKDGLTFIENCIYRVSYNSINGRIYIYNPFGYTDISKSILNDYFL